MGKLKTGDKSSRARAVTDRGGGKSRNSELRTQDLAISTQDMMLAGHASPEPQPHALSTRTKRTKVKSHCQRRQSAPSLILSKALTRTKGSTAGGECVSHVSPDSCALVQSYLRDGRRLVSHVNVKLQTGLQTQHRYILLFTDILIISKAKSVSQVKQKVCVRVSEMWTASCLDEVYEGTTSPEHSFVMGWPTYNCVATFSTAEQKEWWSFILQSRIHEEKKRDEPKNIPLKIYAKDAGNCAHSKTFSIRNSDCTSDIVSLALQQFGLQGSVKDFQLWVDSSNDEAPYPLIGHEFPYSIKMNHIRAQSQDTTLPPDHQAALLPDDTRCQFMLRPRRINSVITHTGEQRSKRRLPLLSWPFRRSSTTELDAHLQPSSPPAHGPDSAPGCLFGRSLGDVIVDHTLFPAIKDMIVRLCNEGSGTHGIFRRSGGAKACRELKQKLDSGDDVTSMSDESVFVIAAVFKEFLRNIPGSLLCEGLYEQWLKTVSSDDKTEELEMDRKTEEGRLQTVQRLIQLLPEENNLLLKYVVAMLHRIQSNADLNQMNSHNLAVCIAPSLLWCKTLCSHGADAKRVCDLVCYLIDNCHSLFGDDISSLLTDLTLDTSSNPGSVGSLQQMSDSCYDSLENELNSEPEDRPWTRLLNDTPSRDSLISLSDCDLDQSEPGEESDYSLPLARIRKFVPAVRQPRSYKLRRCSEPTFGHDSSTGTQWNETRKASLDSSTLQAVGDKDNEFLECNLHQMKLTCKEDVVDRRRGRNRTPPGNLHLDTSGSRWSSPTTSPTALSVSSLDSSLDSVFSQNGDHQYPFPSPHGSPPEKQSDTPHAKNSCSMHPVSESQNFSKQANNGDIIKGSHAKEGPRRNINPPSYQQALKQISKSTTTNTQAYMLPNTLRSTSSFLQLTEGRSPFYRAPESLSSHPLADMEVSSAPHSLSSKFSNANAWKNSGTFSTDIGNHSDSDVTLPLSLFFGQSCQLTMHKSRSSPSMPTFLHNTVSFQHWKARGCAPSSQNGKGYYKKTTLDRPEVSMELEEVVEPCVGHTGSGQQFISYTNQWVEDMEEALHPKESYV